MNHQPLRTRILVYALLPAACGGAPTSTSPSPTVATGLDAGTKLSIVSAETQAPVDGARMSIGGQEAVSGADGYLTLSQHAPWETWFDVTADGFLDRRAPIRDKALRVALWPKTSATGLHEEFTKTIVYTSGSDNATLIALQRPLPGTQEIIVAPSREILAIPEFAPYWNDVLRRMTSATGINYRLDPAPPPGAVTVAVRLEERPGAEPGCESGGVFARGSREIVFCYNSWHPDSPRFEGRKPEEVIRIQFPRILLHEIGHTFGLQHYFGTDGDVSIMGTSRGSSQIDFSAREVLVIRLMLQRDQRNSWPDVGPGVGGLHSYSDLIVD